jgi:hypothetical protein
LQPGHQFPAATILLLCALTVALRFLVIDISQSEGHSKEEP